MKRRLKPIKKERLEMAASLGICRYLIGFGPTLVEPISFAMDRRMLLGVKERAEGELACA